MIDKIPITIIGGGIVGCAIAYELSASLNRELFLIERNKKVPGENQSSRNAGVIHSGIFYPMEKIPLKTKLCINGNRLFYDFCDRYQIPHVRKLYKKGTAQLEPNVRAHSALYVPSAGI